MSGLNTMPGLKLSALLSMGIIAGSMLPVNRSQICIVVITLLCAVLIIRRGRSHVAGVIVVLTGLLLFNSACYELPADSLARLPKNVTGRTIKLAGTVSDIPDADSTRIRFPVSVHKLIHRDTLPVEGEVIVSITLSERDSMSPEISPGQIVLLKGKLETPPGSRNPGEFDYRRYLSLKGIYFVFRAYGLGSLELGGDGNMSLIMRDIIFPSKEYALNCISDQLDGDNAEYLKGLVAGDRSDISEEVRNNFTDAGVTHLIAVSGLNVAYIVISLTLLLSVLRVRPAVSLAVIIVFLAFYCLLTGSTASIVRASIMGILALAGTRMQRVSNFYNLAGISAAAILIADSRQLFDAGFILSFTAVISMVWIYEKIDKVILRKEGQKRGRILNMKRALAAAFFTTFAAQAGTLPITAQYFGKVSVISLAVNMAAVPMANISLAIGFMQIVLSLISNELSLLASVTNDVLLSIQLGMIGLAAGLPGAYFHIRELTLYETAGIFVIIAVIFSVTKVSQIPFRIVCSILLAVIIFCVTGTRRQEMCICFLDVGQGDAAVVLTPGGQCIIVDAGSNFRGYDTGERTIAPFLRRKGITDIDLLILTHNHNDHIGGAEYIISNFNVHKVFASEAGSDDGAAKGLFDLIARKGIALEFPLAGDLCESFENIRLYFLHPGRHGMSAEENLNNTSVAFLLKYKESEILFTGDVEHEAEKEITEKYAGILSADILKSPHHGSITSSTSGLVAFSSPDISVISCGRNNKFGHPSGEVMKRYEYTDCNVLRTDLTGCVTVVTDGRTITASASYSE
ncbi:MAG: DNA internalization-related competence protein ComEC/Rec2 [Ignavibacteria bacterium]|nr:DNA internalization-related competence protein ComEC/Rec2 [Ignavibacteria bacterium]